MSNKIRDAGQHRGQLSSRLVIAACLVFDVLLLSLVSVVLLLPRETWLHRWVEIALMS